MTDWIEVKYDNVEILSRAPFRRALPDDNGYDLYNASGCTITVAPFRSIRIPAGLSVKLPEGCCGLIYPRSSTFGGRGLLVVPALIDSGYTGPLYSVVWNPNLNESNTPILVEPWERVSQLVIMPTVQPIVKVVEELPKTARGTKGFGSTGR